MKNLKTKFLSAAAAILLSAGASYALFVSTVDRLNVSGASLPVLSACGSGALATGSSDTAGTVATATNGCVLTFGLAFVTAPTCVGNDQTTAGVLKIVTTATTMTVALTTSDKFDYVCVGKAGG